MTFDHPFRAKCPFCRKEITAAGNVPGEHQAPTGGDASLCITCGAISVFCDDMALRKPTPQERDELSKNQEILHLVFAWAMMKAFGEPPK